MPRLILTRPRAASERFLAQVEAEMGERVPAIISPLMEIVPSDARFTQSNEGLVLTSENGVKAARRLGFRAGTEAYCVGERTAKAAKDAGFEAVSAGGDASDLVRLVTRLAPPMPLVHVRGEHARGEICTNLERQRIACTEVVGYRQVATPPSPDLIAALEGTEPLVVPLFSPRSALIFGLIEHPQAPLHVIAMSASVAAEVADLGADTVRVAESPDARSMVAATCRRLFDLMNSPFA